MGVVHLREITENGEKMIDNTCRKLLPFLGVFLTGIVPRLYDVFAEKAD